MRVGRRRRFHASEHGVDMHQGMKAFSNHRLMEETALYRTTERNAELK